MVNHPNRSKIDIRFVARFVIKSKKSGRYLSTKADMFGPLQDAREWSTKASAQEMLNSCMHVSHRDDFEVVQNLA